MRDLVLHGSDPDRVDLLVLRRDEHARHAGGVDILDFHRFIQRAVVMVHQVHREEKGLVVAVVAAHHLHHPVNHLSPQAGVDFLKPQTLLVIL